MTYGRAPKWSNKLVVKHALIHTFDGLKPDLCVFIEEIVIVTSLSQDCTNASEMKKERVVRLANQSRNPSEPSFSRNGSRSSGRTRESSNKRAKDRERHCENEDTHPLRHINKPSWLVTISNSSLPFYKAKIVYLKRHFGSYHFERITQGDEEWCVYFASESQARRFFKENIKKRVFDCEIHLNLYHQNKKLDDSSSSSHHSREKQSKSSIS
ncbi:11362_t:CDS:2, partial [Ambispora leptoticha]